MEKRNDPIIQVAFTAHHKPTITSCCNGTSWIHMNFCVEVFTLTVHGNTEIKPIIIAEHYKLAVQTPIIHPITAGLPVHGTHFL